MAQLQVLMVSAAALSLPMFATSHPANAQDLFIEGRYGAGQPGRVVWADLPGDEAVQHREKVVFGFGVLDDAGKVLG